MKKYNKPDIVVINICFDDIICTSENGFMGEDIDLLLGQNQ